MPKAFPILVLTAVPSRKLADRIGLALLDKYLIASIQVSGPIASRFRFRGTLRSAKEWLCTIRTTRPCFDRVQRVIKEMHPYEVPEILAVPITRASQETLNWIRVSCGARRVN